MDLCSCLLLISNTEVLIGARHEDLEGLRIDVTVVNNVHFGGQYKLGNLQALW